MNLLELAERVEKAEGPDKILDFEISEAAGKDYNYTASLDAAMQLVPEGWSARIRIKPRWPAYVEMWRVSTASIEASAATTALTLTAAALRARAAMETL